MRPAERLFELIQLIRGRRLSTAAWLAEQLEVSPRTVYRDVAALLAQGVPIEGEAGIGYRLGKGYELPPLMFTPLEAQALVAAVRLAQGRLDGPLAQQADSALGRILAVLPAQARCAAESLPLFSPPQSGTDPLTRNRLEVLRQAIEVRRVVRVQYLDAHAQVSQRTVRPLGCFFWGTVWTLGAWCELRQDFRSFRLDRMAGLEVLTTPFADEAGKTLADLLRAVRAETAATERPQTCR